VVDRASLGVTLTAVPHGMATAACTIGAPTSAVTITIANSRMISFATMLS
jgi:hypothetical protein